MDVFSDDRFSAVAKDPRFRQLPKQERKVKIDKRFQGMFTDKRFKLKYSVDKRGRPETQSTGENLKKFYELDDESDDDGDETDEDTSGLDSNPKQKKPEDQSVISPGKARIARRRSGRELLVEFRERKAQISGSARKLPGGDYKKQAFGKPASKLKYNVRMSEKLLPSNDYSDTDSEDDEESGLGSDDSNSKRISSKHLDSDAKPGRSWQKQVGIDLARGEGNVETSSSESEDSEDEADQPGPSTDAADLLASLTEELGHHWGELDTDAPREETTSRRLAVCNLDWDCVTASDLFVLLNSFKPTGGVLHSVKIYPSEFGLERMQEEDTKGPQELVEKDEKKEQLKGLQQEKYHREKLRKYQLQRLKYYYAVVECDSAVTANAIYEQCDGMEYETSASRLDLRFVPDDTVFEHEPRDAAADLPDAASYRPVEFQTTALTRAHVQLTWDEDDKRRARQTSEAFGSKRKNVEAMEAHIQAYLASSSSEDEGDGGETEEGNTRDYSSDEEDDGGTKNPESEKGRINKYRDLLKGIEEKEKHDKEDKDMEMEISWEPGLKETTQEIVKKKSEGTGSTPWEKYLEKKKDKKKERKEQRKKNKTPNTEEEEEQQQAFSDDELPEGVDLNDPFFRDSLKDMGGQGIKGTSSKKHKKSEEETEEEKQRKAALELLMLDEEEDGREHFNLKSIMESENLSKSKRKRQLKQQRQKLGQAEDSASAPAAQKTQDSFEIDAADPRFEAIFTSHEYAIDPSNPRFKKTKAMSTLITEKQRRRQAVEGRERDPSKMKERKKDSMKPSAELSQLVKSIKNKTEQFHSRKKLKVDA